MMPSAYESPPRALAARPRPATPTGRAPAPAHVPGDAGRAADLLFGAALAAHLAVVLALRHFPYQDQPNHLARYALIVRALRGAAPAWVDVHLIPTGYVALDLVGAALVAAFGAAAAGKVFALAGAAAVPLGMRRLLGAVAPAHRGWAVVGVLLTFSTYYLSSYLNYVIGVGAVLAWLAAWWPRRAGTTTTGRAALALGVVGLFLTHLSAPLIALLVVGVEMLAAGAAVHAAPRGAWRAALAPRAATLAACATVLAAVFVVSERMGGDLPPILNPFPTRPDPPVVFRPPAKKLIAFGWPFYALSPAQCVLMAGTYFAALALCVRGRVRAIVRHPLGLAALALVAVYVVWPLSIEETRAVDARWLLPAALLPFCAARAGERPPPTRVVAALAGLAVAHAAFVFAVGRHINRDLAAYDRVLARVPADARVVPLVTPTRRHGSRIAPYRHFAMWHLARDGGRVAGLFAAHGLLDDGYAWPHMAHVRERDRMFYPSEDWGQQTFAPLPWGRIWRDADFVVHAGDDDPRIRAELAAHAVPLLRDGDVTLYASTAAAAAELRR